MDDEDCNTTLELGLNQCYRPKKDNDPRVLVLELSIPADVKSLGETCNLTSRKKLKFTSDQTNLLEHTFKQHSTLTTAQKQTLAEKLSVEPRQVEVWFQNRRARKKLKQTEMECNFLKKKCEGLKEENRRLRRELVELRSIGSEAATTRSGGGGCYEFGVHQPLR